MNGLYNAQGLTGFLQRTYSVESMDSDTDRRVANLNLEGITNNYKTWNHLTVCNLICSISFFKCYLQTIHLKNKNEITNKLISYISWLFV